MLLESMQVAKQAIPLCIKCTSISVQWHQFLQHDAVPQEKGNKHAFAKFKQLAGKFNCRSKEYVTFAGKHPRKGPTSHANQ